MPMPQEYQLASQKFDAILSAVRDELGLATRNQAYMTLQAVLIVFRRRLSPQQIISFANVLPSVPRAIFVADWVEDEFVPSFGNSKELTDEIKSIRRHHNFSGDNAIPTVTSVLRRHMDAKEFDTVMETMPEDARRFWSS